MNLILKEKRKSNSTSSVRMGALKVVNHVLSNDKGRDEVLVKCCDRFLAVRGLGVLFPVFMKPRSIIGTTKKREITAAVDEIEEHCVSILLALLKYCSAEGDSKARLVKKFVEGHFEKTERLVELHFKYAEKLHKVDAQIRKEKARLMAIDEEIDENAFFMRRLSEGGLFSLQIVDQIILHISHLHDTYLEAGPSVDSASSIKSQVMRLLNLHANTSIDHPKLIRTIIKDLIQEQTDETEKESLVKLLETF
jgi:beta-catenin-like protein 1